MTKALLSQEELLRLIRVKSRRGAEALYDQYAVLLRLAIFRIVQDKKLTDTILERTIYKIWDTIGLYNEQNMMLLTWMLAIAKDLAREHLPAKVI